MAPAELLTLSEKNMNNANDMAFPIQASDLAGTLDAQPGLTKREYFAAMALQAIIAKNPPCGEQHDNPSDCEKPHVYSEGAVLYADALLAELAK